MITAAARINTQAEALDDCLLQIAQGSSQALEALYRQTSTQIYSFALSMLKSAPDAEDVMHDCYVLVWLAAESYRSSGRPMAWLITIAKNLCLKKLRERQKSADLPPEEYELPASDTVTPEDRLVLQACLRSLSPEECQIVVLHAVSGFKHRQIAQVLELPISTVLSKYNRALKKLRTMLEGGQKV